MNASVRPATGGTEVNGIALDKYSRSASNLTQPINRSNLIRLELFLQNTAMVSHSGG